MAALGAEDREDRLTGLGRFDDGRPAAIEPFATGWVIEDGRAHFGRLAGVATTPDGALLVSDDTNGVVYRIAYTGGR